MPGKGRGKAMDHMGNRGGGAVRDDRGGEMRDDRGSTGGALDDVVHGRSASSPGHLKRDAGAQSARDYAPGHTGEAGRGTVLPEAAPDEMGED